MFLEVQTQTCSMLLLTDSSVHQPYQPKLKTAVCLDGSVCKDFIRGKCNRKRNKCKFYHPPV